MVIRLDENYNAMTSTALLGYVGETNARPVSVEGLTVDGADRYVLTIDYGDGTVYEVDITGGQWTPTADILRSSQTVSCQIAAKKLSGDEYVLVKKSRIFRLRIGAAIGDNAVPSPSVAADALDRIDAIGRQAHADMQTAVTAAETATTMANNAAKSATAAEKSADTAEQAASRAETAKTAAETAAQTAQAVADSLPDDYVTAVGKIAENTAEIGRVKLTDKELTRRVNALYSIGNGITHQFETDTDTAYQKAVPTGGKLMSIKNVGGRSIVFNQLAIRITAKTDHYGITVTVNDDGTINLHGTVSAVPSYNQLVLTQQFSIALNGHKYLYRFSKNTTTTNQYGVCGFGTKGTSSFVFSDNSGVVFAAMPYIHVTEGDVIDIDNLGICVFDLTAMFGSGNEPASVEEFEKIFPNEYYPYNAGEIISADTESVVEQGKNLFDYTDKIYYGANVSKVENGVIYTKQLLTTILNIPTIVGKKYTLSLKTKTLSTNQGVLQWSLQKGKNTAYADDSSLIKKVVGTVANTEYQETVTFTATTDFVSLCGLTTMVYDVQLENGDTATNYSPFYQTAYPIPEAIRNLPGYGWSAGTAKNYVDYENKKYIQCVDSVDLGALNWVAGSTGKVNFQTSQVIGQKLTKSYSIAPNFMCLKYSTKTQDELWGKPNVIGITAAANVDGFVYVNDTSYTDVTAFKQAMQGVILYYELANPIITDISNLIDDDFLRNIEVEAGGSVTFKNSNDSYLIPVPSEEEYIVKLSEVGGTT